MLSDRGPLTRIMPMPPGPGGVAMAAIVSAVLLAGGLCSKGLNESIILM